MYSLMSIRIMAFSSSNKNSASARESSVLPTPGRAEENKRTDRPIRVLQTSAGTAHGVGHGFDRLRPDRPRVDANAPRVCTSFRAFAFLQTRDRNVRPARNNLRDIFFGYFFAEQVAFWDRLRFVRSLRASFFPAREFVRIEFRSPFASSPRRCARSSSVRSSIELFFHLCAARQ